MTVGCILYKTAGFTAGSIPMIGISGYSFLSPSAATLVAVLQAITMAFAPFSRSISAFFFFGNKSAVPITSVSESTSYFEVVKETESKRETESTAVSSDSASQTADPPSQVETQISTDAEGNEVITTIITITTVIDDAPSDPTDTRDSAQYTEPDSVNGQETQPATHSDADQPLSAEASSDHGNVLLVTYNNPQIEDYDSSSSDIGYCLIYDQAGNLMGDSNPYDRMHWAEIVTLDDGTRCIFYYPEERGLFLPDGIYRHTFLSEYRDEIWSREFEVYESKIIFHD